MKSIKVIFILLFSNVVLCSRWSVKMPWFVSAVKGSCAEIPCTFDYPVYGHSPWGMWLKGGSDPRSHAVFIVHDPRDLDKINFNYRGRTELSGNFARKQCFLRIKDIRKSDEGDYYFRPKISKSQYSIEQNTSASHVSLYILEKTSISVSGELIAGQPAQLTCSITHNCPSANLELKWTYDQGHFPFQTETKTSEQNVNGFDGYRRVSSIFTFVPSSDIHGKTLGCKLIVEGVEATVQKTLTMAVEYKPSVVSGPNCTISESGIDCTCSVRANPPANITWGLNGRTITRNSSDEVISWAVNGHLVPNSLTLTHPTRTGNQISCVAANEHGVTFGKHQLHSADKPSIVSGPNCTICESGIDCTCSVRANPPANITWGLNGRNVTRNSSDEVISWAVNGHLVQSSLILTHPTGTGNQISCVAANEHGVSFGKYQHNLAGTFPWKIVIPVAAAATLIILFLIAVMVRRKKARDTVSVPPTNSDSVISAAVQHPFNNESQGQYANSDVRGAAAKQSAGRENLLYAAVKVSNVRKHEKYLQNAESIVHSSRWSVKMPWFVSAVKGSCAEIPCTFDYPVYGHSPWGMWLKGGSDPSSHGVFIVYDPKSSDNINFIYMGRTELNGNFAKKQCSLRIKDIRKSDEGDYYFRPKISKSQNSFEQHPSRSHVSLSILEKPSVSVSVELIAGQPAQLTCSITHNCPSANLELKWTYDQGYFPFLAETKTSEQNVNGFDGYRRVSSIFTFVPSSDIHGKTLGCKVIVEGVEATVQETLTLAVKLPAIPRKPTVNSSIVAVEGSSVLLYCTTQGKLPVSLRWVRDGLEISMSSTGELRQIFHNISSKDDGQYWCVAENIVGNANSSTQISVQYQPSVVSGPSCTISESGIDCTCSVRANPPANITWGLNGRNITRNSSDEVISWAVNGHLVQSSLTLTHPTRTRNQISYVAANTHGISVAKYQFHSAGTFPWKIVIPVAAAATLIILFLIAVMALRKKTRDTVNVPPTNSDSVTDAVVQHPFNTESQGQYANTDVRGAAAKQSAERENVLYAAVKVSNVRKHEKYLRNAESSEYAAIKFK
ncbi:hemicentin-1-like [Heptranchias perlo]|uniref:hemicentin-1-like n=1 Tax=Heptranchias perlo TaxID=212740 RepID=UPI00355A7AAD